MFDLNQSITQWQRKLASAGPVTQDERDELAEHLKEQVAELQQTGLSEEESFLVASQRLGDARQLTDEIMHANPARRWVHLALVGFISLMALLAAASLFASILWMVEGGWPQVRSNLAAFGSSLLDWPNLLLLSACLVLAVGIYRLLISRLFPAYRLTFVLALLAMLAGQWAFELAMISSAPLDPSYTPRPGDRAGHALTFSLVIVTMLPVSTAIGLRLKQRRAQHA